MNITRGKISTAQKIVIYGPEGIGKSTFAAQFPDPVYIDTEGSTKHMDVARLPKPSSWAMLLEEVKQIRDCPEACRTLVIDTADWAEQLCISHVCSKAKKDGIEDFGYGKGYIYVAEEFGRLLNLLEEIVDRGVHIVITAHAKMRKFEQPDEMGAYDRWEMKLSKNVAPLVKEWADMVLFANYKTFAVATDDSGKKFKAQGGTRVMYTSHHPCWDAKNRHGLKEELPFSFSEIAHCVQMKNAAPAATAPASSAPPAATASPSLPNLLDFEEITDEAEESAAAPAPHADVDSMEEIPKALIDLMKENNVSPEEIRWAVADRGYYPEATPIANYDPQFVEGVLVNAWPQVFQLILENRKVPF